MILTTQKSLPSEKIDLIFPKSSPHNFLKNSGISIIIPTYKRVKLCHKLLQSLAVNQQKIKIPIEIIIIDNSPHQEAQKIASFCADCGVNYYHKTISVAAKRNFGANIAQYSLLLFIDSDCQATPNLIKEHCLIYERDFNAKAVLGSTTFKGKKSLIWPALQLTPFLEPFRLADEYSERVWGPSNNFSIRKDVFEDIGGFNENFPQKPGGEDVDFGYRLYQKGYIFKTNPLARVYHTTETWNSLKQNVQRFFHWGKGEFYLYVNHPNYLYYDVPKSSLIFF
ncbi:MAG: glycosyltransferase family 2 protein, partial [Crocosphaera sp.]